MEELKQQEPSQTILNKLDPEFIGLIRHLFTRGTASFIIIFGRRETGKTDFALLLSEILVALGIIKHVASNIKIYNSPFPITHITDLENLRLWAYSNRGKKLFLFDEYGKAMRRRSPMSKLNNDLIDDLQTLRKPNMSTIACTVDEKYIDNASLGSDVLDGVFIKTDYKNPKVALYNDLLEYFHKELEDIPATSIKFDEWDVAPFKRQAQNKKPQFKDADLAVLWDLTHDKTAKDLGLHTQQVTRIWKKFIKEVLERDYHTSQERER